MNDKEVSIMIDLETMGVRYDASIVSIGAVAFTMDKIIDKFYKRVSLSSSLKNGGTVSADTIFWWMCQSSQALKEITAQEGVGIEEALSDFKVFVMQYPIDACVWGNGSDFDNVILRSAYGRCGMAVPWLHDRCYRTLKKIYSNIKIRKVGIKHHALNDAESQAIHLMEIFTAIREKDKS